MGFPALDPEGTKRFPVGLPSTHTLVAWKKNMMEVKGTPPSFLCPSYLFLRPKTKRTVTAINDSENSWNMAAGDSKSRLLETRKNLGTTVWVS